MMNKKASNWIDYWAEYVSFAFLAIGFVFAVMAGSAVILYVVAILFGGMFGRWWWKFKASLKVPVVVIIMGFLIGYIIGSFYGSRKVVLVLFLAGMVASYVLHERKIIHSAEY